MNAGIMPIPDVLQQYPSVAPKDRPIIKKLATIMKEVGWIEKRGHNDHHKYDYVTESDVVDALRKHLAEAGIMSVPYVESVETLKTEKGLMANIIVRYNFVDSDGDSIAVRVAGSGYDIPGDKAIYKAMTGAEKYALRQLFLIPTGDDPERDEQDHLDSKRPASVRSEGGGPHGAPQAATQNARGGPGNAAPATARPAPAASGEDRDRTVAFGKNKGKKIDELNEADLAWWTKTCEEAVAKNDEKWHKLNVKKLEACKAEWSRRQPWRTVWNTCVALGEEQGIDAEGVETLLKSQCGITRADELTPDHVEMFKAVLANG